MFHNTYNFMNIMAYGDIDNEVFDFYYYPGDILSEFEPLELDKFQEKFIGEIKKYFPIIYHLIIGVFVIPHYEKNPDKLEIEYGSKIYGIKRRKIRINNMENSIYRANFNNREIGINEFIEELESNRTDNENEIWITGESEYPCISVMIKGNAANINFFKSADDFAACLNDENTANGAVDFGDIEIERQFVIDRKKAIECIREFVNTSKRPECVKWFEL